MFRRGRSRLCWTLRGVLPLWASIDLCAFSKHFQNCTDGTPQAKRRPSHDLHAIALVKTGCMLLTAASTWVDLRRFALKLAQYRFDRRFARRSKWLAFRSGRPLTTSRSLPYADNMPQWRRSWPSLVLTNPIWSTHEQARPQAPLPQGQSRQPRPQAQRLSRVLHHTQDPRSRQGVGVFCVPPSLAGPVPPRNPCRTGPSRFETHLHRTP